MIHIGSMYNTNNYGPVIVLKKSASDYYTVKFLHTGTIKNFRSSQIKEGCVRDPYAKSVCGVACTGDIKTKGKYKVFYSIWHDMINRCYNANDKRHYCYLNTTVVDRWLVFENFYQDVKDIDGFDEEKIQNGLLVLDKDLKQPLFQHKVYSKETCTWISKAENAAMQDQQQHLFIAVSPTGETFESRNITSFAKQHNLRRKHISGVLHGRAKTSAGWRFYLKR